MQHIFHINWGKICLRGKNIALICDFNCVLDKADIQCHILIYGYITIRQITTLRALIAIHIYWCLGEIYFITFKIGILKYKNNHYVIIVTIN